MEGLERRNDSSKRIDVKRPVAIFVPGRNGILRGRTRNISTGGCSIELDDVLEIGDEVLFRIDLGEGFDPAVQSVKVVWSDPSRKAYGVAFKDGEKKESVGKIEENEEIPQAGEIVKLALEKMEKPLKVTWHEKNGETFCLKTSIPFFETPQKVTVHYKNKKGEDKEISGILFDVDLLKSSGDNPPFLQLKVTQNMSPEKEIEETKEKEKKEKIEVTQEVSGKQESIEVISEEKVENKVVQNEEEIVNTQTQTIEETEKPEKLPHQCEIIKEEAITPQYVVIVRRIMAMMMKAFVFLKSNMGPVVSKCLVQALKIARIIVKASVTIAGSLRERISSRVYRNRTTVMRRGLQKQKKSHTFVLIARVIILGVVAFSIFAGVWGLVKLVKTNNMKDLPEPPAAKTQVQTPVVVSQSATENGQEKFDVWSAQKVDNKPSQANGGGGGVQGPQAPSAQGNISAASVLAPPSEIVATPSEKGIKDEIMQKATSIEMEDTIVTGRKSGTSSFLKVAATTKTMDGVKTDPPQEEPPPAKVKKNIPILVDKTVRLYINGDILGVKHYPLKEPAGLVVDVKGASPVLGEGKKEFEGAKIKSLKTIKREDGTRFIILFNSKTIPAFEIFPRKDRIDVKI